MDEQTVEVEGTTAPEAEIPTEESLLSMSDEDLEALVSGKTESVAESAQPETEEQPPTLPEEGPKAEEPTELEQMRSQIQQLQQQLEETQRTNQQKELFIQRRNTELGELRKQYTQAIQQLQSGIENKMLQNPAEAIQDGIKVQQYQAALENINQEEAFQVQETKAREIVSQYVKPDDCSVADLVAVLRHDGNSEEAIQRFTQNPYRVMSPEGIINLVQRTKALRYQAEIFKVAKSEHERRKALEAELEKSRKKPQAVAQGISRALKASPTITAGNVVAQESRPLPPDPSQWGDSELEEFLRNN